MRSLRIIPLILLLATGVLHAEQDDRQINWLVGIGGGVTEFKFDEKFDADPSFNTYNLFASAGIGKGYATLAYSSSISDEDISEEEDFGQADREDIDFTIGYNINDAWSVFVGYKDGESEIDWQVRDEPDERYSESYAEDGFYAGVSYGFDLGQAGVISLSAAYIRFDTDLRFFAGEDEEEDEEEEDEPLEFDDLTGRQSSNSDGYSVGVSWLIPVADNLAVRMQYKINKYNLKVKTPERTFHPDQRFSYLDIGLMLAF